MNSKGLFVWVFFEANQENMPIAILSDETINKIAAGEVVERPANAVKELLENSLDAQASAITIEFDGAGRKTIRVSDNGIGMSRQDIALAVTRHATSKIKEFDDLSNLSTMGFRGEALPSIASVSHLSIKSHPRGAPDGWEIELSAGKIIESRAWAGAGGTIIEARQLFFNTPARAKFLKSDTTERLHIIRIIEEIAIARHDIGFNVISEGKSVLKAPSAKNILERLADVLGASFTKTLVPFNANHPNVTISGYVTKKENSIPSRNSQYLFVNKRPVTPGKIITHALYEAYRETMPSGRHPGAVIFIDINPAEIDCNIHPAKREVRFSQEREIHDILYRAVKTAILQPAAILLSQPYELESKPVPAEINEPSKSYFNTNDTKPLPTRPEQPSFILQHISDSFVKPLGQIFSTYIAAQKQNDFIIIDQHAAAERIRYEKYMSEWNKKQVTRQGLLIAVSLEVPPGKALIIKNNIKFLQETGWDIEEFGMNAFRITAIPSALGNDREAQNVFYAVIDALLEETQARDAEKIEKIIRSACKASIKAKEYMPQAEMEELLKQLFKCQMPYTCPHGRPTILKLSKEDLEKHFKRI